MSGCKIGKIRMKSGGASVHVLENKPRTELHKSLDNIAMCLNDDDPIFIAYVCLYKDRTSRTGWSYLEGITDSDMLGSIKRLETHLINTEID